MVKVKRRCRLPKRKMHDYQEFLKKHGFEEYWSRFDSNGYDVLAQLKDMSTEELDKVLETC